MRFSHLFICALLMALPAAGQPLSELITLSHQQWGELGIDQAAHAKGRTGRPMQIGDTHYKHGVGIHANGQIAVDLLGEFQRFEAEVGVQAHPGHDQGSVVFRVIVDGETRFDSGVMRQRDPARPVKVDLTGAYDLLLEVSDGGDNITNDLGNWANAVLVPADASQTMPRPARVNIAPFARVMAWDRGQTGSHPGRVEEMSVEQIFLGDEIFKDAGGIYTAPEGSDGPASLGLQWYENRYLVEFALTPDASLPPAALEGAIVQWWEGESEWQGDWKPLQGKLERDGEQWRFRVAREDAFSAKIGIQKVRWIFPKSAGPVKVRAFEAYTRSRADTIDLRLEREGDGAGEATTLALYNGDLLAPDAGAAPARLAWDATKPLTLSVRYLKSREGFAKSDQTVLAFELPEARFGVSVEAVVDQGCVYLPDSGVFVARADGGPTLAEYKASITGRNSTLQDVRGMPDQSFAQAMEKVHRDVQDKGPSMLSLACDNHKFTVYENGGVQHRHDSEAPPGAERKYNVYNPKYPVEVDVRLNGEELKKAGRHLEQGWMPLLNTRYAGDVAIRQRAFVAPYGEAANADGTGWLNEKPLFVSEYALKNEMGPPKDVALSLHFRVGKDRKQPATVLAVARGAVAMADGRLLAFVDSQGAEGLSVAAESGEVTLRGSLAAGASARCLLYLPGWETDADGHASIDGGMALDEKVVAYWNRILAPTMQIRLPEPLLQDVITASQVHCLMLARNELEGQSVSPWVGADRYGALESESHAVVHGMSLVGHQNFARNSLEFFIRRYNQDGLLTTGYTLMGVGWHLWTLADYFAVYDDRLWLEEVAPKLERACRWIARESEKTRRLNADGSKPLDYGLVAPGVAADWSRFAYVARCQGEYYAGLRGVADAYEDIGYPAAGDLAAAAETNRRDIRQAYELTQGRSPAVELRNGTWVPYCPALFGCFGRVMDIYPKEDGNRSWGKDMSMGAHNLVVLGVLDEDDRQSVEWITNYLEDYWCVQGGMGAYTPEEVQADWFNLGGFSKIQPYYTRLVEVYAKMDDVKPFIRGYFNAMPTLLNRENMNFWEHFGNRGAWDKPHETGWFLVQTRLMLLRERKDELWLAPFVTNHWMEDGMSVSIEQAPSEFGPVGYTITSHVNNGYIEAAIQPPSRREPSALVLRLRHPEEKPMQSATVNGKPHTDFDAQREVIRLAPGDDVITVKALY